MGPLKLEDSKKPYNADSSSCHLNFNISPEYSKVSNENLLPIEHQNT